MTDTTSIDLDAVADSPGDRLRRIRRATGLGQAEFGAALGIGSRVGGLETGKTQPKDDELRVLGERIEELYGIPATWFEHGPAAPIHEVPAAPQPVEAAPVVDDMDVEGLLDTITRSVSRLRRAVAVRDAVAARADDPATEQPVAAGTVPLTEPSATVPPEPDVPVVEVAADPDPEPEPAADDEGDAGFGVDPQLPEWMRAPATPPAPPAPEPQGYRKEIHGEHGTLNPAAASGPFAQPAPVTQAELEAGPNLVELMLEAGQPVAVL